MISWIDLDVISGGVRGIGNSKKKLENRRCGLNLGVLLNLCERGAGRLERMKHGCGIKDRDDKSSGIEILMTDPFPKINPSQWPG